MMNDTADYYSHPHRDCLPHLKYTTVGWPGSDHRNGFVTGVDLGRLRLPLAQIDAKLPTSLDERSDRCSKRS
jgi:hypothetical protein